jgi:hypothetical protein
MPEHRFSTPLRDTAPIFADGIRDGVSDPELGGQSGHWRLLGMAGDGFGGIVPDDRIETRCRWNP